MHLLIFDVSHHGHRTQYAGEIIRAVADLPLRVTFATGEAAVTSAQFRTYLAPLASHFDLHLLPDLELSPGWRRSSGTARQLRELTQRLRPDHVFVPYIDGVAQVAALGSLVGRRAVPAATEVEGLSFRGRWLYEHGGIKSRLRGAFKRWALARSLTRIHHLDPYVYEEVLRRGGDLATRVALMPEPSDVISGLAREEARSRLGLPSDVPVLGAIGLLDTHKGVDRVMHAFQRIVEHSDAILLLAGPCRQAVRSLLDGPMRRLVGEGRIVVQDRFLGSDEIANATTASDVVLAAYPHHIGSSSIVVRAARAGRPVLASDFGWIGRTVSRFGLGWTADVTDEAALLGAMRSSLDEARAYEQSERAKRFCSFHTPENFRLAWTVRIRERLGLPPAQGRVDWEWVCAAASEAGTAG